MIRAERMLEARVARTGIDEIREPKLPHIAQTLERARIHELQGQWIDADVVPERISYDLVHETKDDRKTGRQEDRKTGRQEDRKTGRQDDRKRGRQEDRKTEGHTVVS